MSIHLDASFRKAIAISSIIASSVLLYGCSEEETPAAEKIVKVEATAADPVIQSVTSSIYSSKNLKVKTFPNPGMGEDDEYLDILYPTTAFQLYHSLRDWEETPEQLAEFVKLSVSPEVNVADVFRLGSEYQDEKDEFKKRDLMEKIAAETRHEADKVKGKKLVKFYNPESHGVYLNIGAYDFDLKAFRIDDCLFSDKLNYTKEERRFEQQFRGVEQERCYFKTTNGHFKVGFTGGSSVLLKVEDETLAREIASKRKELKVKVYGYIQAVEFASSESRTILVAPQKIDLLDANRQVIYSSTI